MPSFDLAQQPRFPLQIIDTDSPISTSMLTEVIDHKDGITLLIRSATGHEKRGGHFFCIENHLQSGELLLETIEGESIDTFSVIDMVSFINHASGLAFDRSMQMYCQNSLNFRVD